MIYDKIKIYVTAHIADILTKDTEAFEFFKKDGTTLNKNALLTRLVVNYSDEFREKENELFHYLQKSIGARTRVSDQNLKALCFEISEHLSDLSAAPNGEKFDKLISLKPTKESQPVIDYIEEYALEGSSLSEYFRNMFASYAALPQDKREGIIFKEQKNALLRAIKEKKKVFVCTTNSVTRAIEIAPYALSTTKEELHCYLIATNGKGCIPLRLSRITSVTILNKDAEFDETQVSIFERMLVHGPQFTYSPYEQEIKVQLSPKGIKKFQKIYLHRPIPVSIEKDIYTFRCSYVQAVQYFSRLGPDAYVISPTQVRDEIQSFYRRGYNFYKNREEKKDLE